MPQILFLILCFFVLSIVNATRKKRAERQGKQQTPKVPTPASLASALGSGQSLTQAMTGAFTGSASRAAASREGEDPCHEEQLTRPAAPLRSSVLDRMPPPAAPEMGPEGEDACHAYMETAKETKALPEKDAPALQPNPDELLRGVILSEVLSRRPPLRPRRHS